VGSTDSRQSITFYSLPGRVHSSPRTFRLYLVHPLLPDLGSIGPGRLAQTTGVTAEWPEDNKSYGTSGQTRADSKLNAGCRAIFFFKDPYSSWSLGFSSRGSYRQEQAVDKTDLRCADFGRGRHFHLFLAHSSSPMTSIQPILSLKEKWSSNEEAVVQIAALASSPFIRKSFPVNFMFGVGSHTHLKQPQPNSHLLY
jgi:hypothetical protein